MTKFHFPVSILCYDGGSGEGSGDGSGNSAATQNTTPPAGDASGGQFTQDQVNKFLADDRRKHQSKFEKLEQNLAAISEDKTLSEQQRDAMKSEVEDLRKSLRTKETQAEVDRKASEERYKTELDSERERANHWEGMFKTNEIQRSLQDAAVGAEAFNPGHIVALLAPNTQLKDQDGRLVPMVDFPDIDEKTGEETRTLRTPADAVKRMRELPKIHGCLFKSNVVSGVGAGQGPSGDPDSVDYASMTPEEYRKNRAAIKQRLSQ